MEKTSNVQLHKIIKNSLASYLSYKWSKNKLYLKKRKNKARREKSNREKTSTRLEKKHSVINLENDIFIYDAKTKTFTQLDLCDCFKNGLKYRKLDPFNTQPSKKKHELPPTTKDSSEDSREFKNLQLTDLEDSVEQIFSNQLLKKNHWGKGLKAMSPSKFDLFIQKELNKYNGKNIKVKSFNINSKQNIEKQPKNNLQSSAAIGYYKITFDDNALQCDSQTEIHKIKRINFVDTKEGPLDTNRRNAKGSQYKRNNHYHRASKKEEEKVSPRNETGIQCVMKSPRNTKEKKKFDLLDSNLVEIMTHHKKLPHLKPKSHRRKKALRRRPSSMIRINSSAEIRKMLIEKRSSPSFTLSNTGDYFRTFLHHQHPRTLLTYYQTSSSSRDNGGDTYDEQYFKNQHIVVATTSNPISPICSGPCGTKRRPPPACSPCTCTCGTTYEKPRRNQSDDSNLGKLKKNARIQERQDIDIQDIDNGRTEETQSDKKTQEIQHYDRNDVRTQEIQSNGDDVPIETGGRRLTKTASVQKELSSIHREPEYDKPKSQTLIRVESQSKSIDTREMQPPSDTRSDSRRLTRTASAQRQPSGILRDPESERPKSQTLIRVESQSKSMDAREIHPPSDTRPAYSRQNLSVDIRIGDANGEQTKTEDAQKQKHVVCITDCADPCNVKNAKSVCSCCNQPIVEKKPCCACPPDPPTTKSKCICDILTCLKERIKIQTEEQNRNLDQILEELNKQDLELKEIRNFVEKYNDSKKKAAGRSTVRECSCYAVTVQHGFTTDMKPLPDTLQNKEEREANSVRVQKSKSSEPEIIELFGSNEAFQDDKRPKRILKKESWKALWNRNSEIKAFFVTDMLKKRSIQKKFTSSSNTTTDDYESKKMKKHWFSQLFTSKKDLRKIGS